MIIIRKLSIYSILFVAILLSACSSGDSGPAEAEQLRAIQEQTRAYFLYTSDQSIKAIDIADPTNPITVEESIPAFSGAIAAKTALQFGGMPTKHYSINNTLIYIKDGKLWIVDDISTGNLTPRQLSSEDSAFNLCSTSLSHDPAANDRYLYRYSLPGSNGCYDLNFYQDSNNNGVWLPQFSDVTHKWVASDFTDTTPPNSVSSLPGWSRSDSIIFYQFNNATLESDVTGVLALDNSGNLIWFNGMDFSAPSHTVAINVTSVNFLKTKSRDRVYLIVDGHLYSYTAGDNSLGDSLYQLSSESFHWVTYSSPTTDLIYAADDQKLLSIDRNRPAAPSIISEHSLLSTTFRVIGSTDDFLYLYAGVNDRAQAFSVNRTSGAIAELFSVSSPGGTLPNFITFLINDKFYVTDEALQSTVIFGLQGNILNNFPNTFILKVISSTVYNPEKDPRSHILLGEYGDNPQKNVSVLDTNRNVVISQLGAIPYGNYYLPGYGAHYNGKTIVSLRDDSLNYSLYFADLYTSNSLVPLTDGSTNDNEIYSVMPLALQPYSIPPPPPPPGPPPPPPAPSAPPPPPSEPPPPPPPPPLFPPGPGMGGGMGGM